MAHDLSVHLTVDLRMRGGVQKAPLLDIGENDAAQLLAIDGLVIVEDLVAELGADFLPCRFTGLHDCA